MPWGVKWRSENSLDGKREYLVGCHFTRMDEPVPPRMAGYSKIAFKTRREAREYIKQNFSYIKDRPDLQKGPHGWKMPVAVKIKITVEEA